MNKLFFSLLLCPLCLFAQPGPTAQNLMNQPASMFDVGMIRMRYALDWAKLQSEPAWKNQTQSRSGIDINAYYDTDRDRIKVSISAMDWEIGEEQLEEGCDRALKPVMITMSKSIPGLFLSVGHELDKGEISRLRDELADIIEVHCIVWGRATTDLRYKKVTGIKTWQH
ncbi:MAG: hypothetical protein QNJ40_23480 [Xanthomonadales bacterium]|nr:hypothetical protein [Xanthomonadales bacterium]